MKIEIKGLYARACHGVLESEKTNPQDFFIDIALCYDGEKAAQTDDVGDAVNYADVCDLAYGVCANGHFSLIERLADRIALGILQGFKKVKCAEVTVHKPQAPVGQRFSDISVTCVRERAEVILSLGSSLGDGDKTLRGALEMLGETEGIEITRVSPFIKTPPYGGVARGEFTNCAAVAECLLSPRELLEALHAVENAFGRVRKERWDDRTLDIDIIFFGDKIIRERGLSIPHPDYANRQFVLEPIKSVASDFVCPLSGKRMSDL